MDMGERRSSGVDTLLFDGAPEAAQKQADEERRRAAGQVTLQYDDDQLQEARQRFNTDNQPKISRSVYDVLPDELRDKVTAEMVASVPSAPRRDTGPLRSDDPDAPVASGGFFQSLVMAGAGAGLVFVVALVAAGVAAGVVAAVLYM